MNNAIFACPINPVFAGKLFSEVSNILYHEYQVVFFAVSTQIRDRKHLILNPGMNYMLRATDEMFFIASNHQDVELILHLV